MRIISWNVNGLRACIRKGSFLDFIEKHNPDIICLQEMKAKEEDLTTILEQFSQYHILLNPAEKKGYSGVAVFSKIKPNYVKKGKDSEGRILELGFDNFTLFNVYFPNGQKNEERLNYKLNFYADLFEYIQNLRKQGQDTVICGDYNTAHQEIDLARPKQNENTSGFLRIERDWLDKIIQMKYFDTFRYFNKDPENYSWWSYRFKARERNVGWRIDYFFVNEEFISKVIDAFILQDVLGSDHAPVGITLNS
ncbi:MAG: exodeoxyribonuclease III [bacterium]|nr:exodeoxyribonuclease III [bacterium]